MSVSDVRFVPQQLKNPYSFQLTGPEKMINKAKK